MPSPILGSHVPTAKPPHPMVWCPGQSPVGKLRPGLALPQDSCLRINSWPCEPTFLLSAIPLLCCRIENPYARQMSSEGTGGGNLGARKAWERDLGGGVPNCCLWVLHGGSCSLGSGSSAYPPAQTMR